MTLPLNVFDLDIGNLYKGWWMNPRTNEIVEDVLLQRDLSTGALGGVVSLSCFVFLEKEPDIAGQLLCKILTRNGEVGWVCFVKGAHWFKELTGDNL